MAKRMLINPDIKNSDVIVFPRGVSSHTTEGTGTNITSVGSSATPVIIGQEFAGHKVLNIDSEKGFQIQKDNGETTWIRNDINARVVPYLDENGDLNLFQATRDGIKDIQDYGGFNLTQEDINEVVDLNKYYDADTKQFDLSKAYQDGMSIDIMDKYFNLTDALKANITNPPTVQETSTLQENIATSQENIANVSEEVPSVPETIVSEQTTTSEEAIEQPQNDNPTVYDKLANYTDNEGNLSVESALQNGISQAELQSVGVTTDLIEQARKNIELTDKYGKYITRDRKLDFEKVLQDNLNNDDLSALGLSDSDITQIRLIQTYAPNGYFDVQKALNDNVDEAAIINLFTDKDAITQQIDQVKIVNKYSTGDNFDLVQAINDNVPYDLLQSLNSSWNKETLDRVKELSEFQNKGYYDADGNTTIEYARNKGANDTELIKMGFTDEDIKNYNRHQDNKKDFLSKIGSFNFDVATKGQIITAYNKGDYNTANELFSDVLVGQLYNQDKLTAYQNGDLDDYSQVYNYDNIAKLKKEGKLDTVLNLTIQPENVDAWKTNYNDFLAIRDFIELKNTDYSKEGSIDDYIYEAPQSVLDSINRLYGTDFQHGKYVALMNGSDYLAPFKSTAKDKDLDVAEWLDFVSKYTVETTSNNKTISKIADKVLDYSGLRWKLEQEEHAWNTVSKLFTGDQNIDVRSIAIDTVGNIRDKVIAGQETIRNSLHSGELGPVAEYSLSIANEVVLNDLLLDPTVIVLSAVEGAGNVASNQKSNQAKGIAELGGLVASIITYPLTIPKTTKDNTAQGVAEIASVVIPNGTIKSAVGLGKVSDGKLKTFDDAKEVGKALDNDKFVISNTIDNVGLVNATGKILDASKYDNFKPSGKYDELTNTYKTESGSITALINTDKTTWTTALNNEVTAKLDSLVKQNPDAQVNVILGNYKITSDNGKITQTMIDKKGVETTIGFANELKGADGKALYEVVEIKPADKTTKAESEYNVRVEEIKAIREQKDAINQQIDAFIQAKNETGREFTPTEKKDIEILLDKRNELNDSLYGKNNKESKIDDLEKQAILGRVSYEEFFAKYEELINWDKGSTKSKTKVKFAQRLLPIVLVWQMLTTTPTMFKNDRVKFVPETKIEQVSVKTPTGERLVEVKTTTESKKTDAKEEISQKQTITKQETKQNTNSKSNVKQNLEYGIKSNVDTGAKNVQNVDYSAKNEISGRMLDSTIKDFDSATKSQQNIDSAVNVTNKRVSDAANVIANQSVKSAVQTTKQNKEISDNTPDIQNETGVRDEQNVIQQRQQEQKQNVNYNVRQETSVTSRRNDVKENKVDEKKKSNFKLVNLDRNIKQPPVNKDGDVVVAWRQGTLRIRGKNKPVWVVVRNQNGVLTRKYETTTPPGANNTKGKPWQTVFKVGKRNVKPIKVKVGFSTVTIDFNKQGKSRMKFEKGDTYSNQKTTMKLPTQEQLMKNR